MIAEAKNRLKPVARLRAWRADEAGRWHRCRVSTPGRQLDEELDGAGFLLIAWLDGGPIRCAVWQKPGERGGRFVLLFTTGAGETAVLCKTLPALLRAVELVAPAVRLFRE